MASIISVHSFRGGTGKSNMTANLAAVIAAGDRRVGVIDTDIQSPGLHVLFGLSGEQITWALNDYLWDGGEIASVAQAVGLASHGATQRGRIFLIPSSTRPGEITRALREGYDPQRLTDGLRRLIGDLSLDFLIIDTHPGLHEETLLSLAISDTVLIVMRPDHQDYEGTGITVRVARRLQVPRMLLAVNKTPAVLDHGAVKAQVEEAYGCDVVAVLPHSEEMMNLASAGVFVLEFPDHPLSGLFRTVATRITAQ
ncbi:MAG TPA: MinD/ParA family protein [Gaiellaceae bacterium]|nr:MinD/ParA family protein [Gaiellaceae bacterium]